MPGSAMERRNREEDRMTLLEPSLDSTSLRSRALERIAYLENQASTFTTPLHEADPLELEGFLNSFQEAMSNPEQRLVYKRELDQNAGLATIYETVVVRRKQVKYEEFWERYEYRCDLSRVMYRLFQDDFSSFTDPSMDPPPPSSPSTVGKHHGGSRMSEPMLENPGLSTATVTIDITATRRGVLISVDSPFDAAMEHSTPTESVLLQALEQVLETPGTDELEHVSEAPAEVHHFPNDPPLMVPQNLTRPLDDGNRARRHSAPAGVPGAARGGFSMDPETTLELRREPPLENAAQLEVDPKVDEWDRVGQETDESMNGAIRLGAEEQYLPTAILDEADDWARRLEAQARENELLEHEVTDEIDRRLEQAMQLEQVRLVEEMTRLEAAYKQHEEEASIAPLPMHTIEAVGEEEDHVGDLTTSMEDYSFEEDSFDALLNSAQQVLQNVQDDQEIESSYIDLDSSHRPSFDEKNDYLSEFSIFEDNGGGTLDGNHGIVTTATVDTVPQSLIGSMGEVEEPPKFVVQKIRNYALFALSICLPMAASSVVFWVRSNERTGNLLCAPAKPGSILSETSLTGGDDSFCAPWWAPDVFKDVCFSVFCPLRTQTEIQAMKLRKGHLQIEIVDTTSKAHLLSWKRLRYLEISSGGEKIHVDTPRGKRTLYSAPWIIKREIASA